MKGTNSGRFILALAGILMAAGLASAQGPGGGSGMGPGFGQHRPPMERAFRFDGEKGQFWNHPQIVAELKLTDDQRKAMDAILLEHREKLVDLQGSVEKAELEMEPLMKADEPNEAAILAQIDKIAQARAELEKANARFLLALRSKLTPEQWKQMEADRANHGDDKRGGWGHDGQGMHGHDGQGMHGQGGQFRRQGPPPPPPGQPAAPAPAPQAPGSGDRQ